MSLCFVIAAVKVTAAVTVIAAIAGTLSLLLLSPSSLSMSSSLLLPASCGCPLSSQCASRGRHDGPNAVQVAELPVHLAVSTPFLNLNDSFCTFVAGTNKWGLGNFSDGVVVGPRTSTLLCAENAVPLAASVGV
jgi:hypothetical protein